MSSCPNNVLECDVILECKKEQLDLETTPEKMLDTILRIKNQIFKVVHVDANVSDEDFWLYLQYVEEAEEEYNYPDNFTIH